jgi:hypothetical protein
VVTRGAVRLGLLAIWLLGCDDQAGPIALRDSEGRRFFMSCKGSTCTYQRASSAPISKEKSGLELRTSGRVVGMCDVEPSSTAEIADCRALVCKADRECPPMHGLEAGHCVNGLCTSPDKDLIADDAVLLCLAGTGLGRNAPKQVERYALAMNCGRPGVVPAPCRQP